MPEWQNARRPECPTDRMHKWRNARLKECPTDGLPDLQTAWLADRPTCRPPDLQTARLADRPTCRPPHLLEIDDVDYFLYLVPYPWFGYGTGDANLEGTTTYGVGGGTSVPTFNKDRILGNGRIFRTWQVMEETFAHDRIKVYLNNWTCNIDFDKF